MALTTRRTLLKTGAAGAAGFALASRGDLLGGQALPKKTLTAGAFRMLPLGEVRPAGWLQRQLRIQADGMGGHLDEFWPDVGPNSGWLGGTGESWERGPYFLDGLVPLAWQLDDSRLKAKGQRFVEWTLTHQRTDGMIGPAANDDWWPRMVMVKALQQYFEATGDVRVVPALTRYFHYQLGAMPGRPLREWGKHRWQDQALVVEWLYDKTGDAKLLELIALLGQQGFDWPASFAQFKYTAQTAHGHAENMETHGVNNGQGLKTAAVQYRLTGDPGAREAFFRQMGALDRYHGMPNGMFSCDEHLAGLKPSQGTELCTVVETMFSLEVALAVFGDAAIADRLEKITFNALPGTFDDAMWAHQYDQQPNQIQVALLSKPWTTNGPESNLYGLEPNFGCCTANFHQGWPKFTSSLWMGTQDNGLAAVLYSPCAVKTKVRGVGVEIAEETDYPFREGVRLTVTPEKPLSFPLMLRIPAWAQGAAVKVNGSTMAAGEPGAFLRVDRTWSAGDTVELAFPMKPRVSRWYNQSVAVERGPLVFSLDPGQHWVKLRDRGLTADWQVYPTGAWNYALAVDEQTAAGLRVTETTVGARPFSTAEAAVRIEAPAALLDTWLSEDGVAQAPPASPVESTRATETITLVPYAGAKLRVTAFPQANVPT